MKYYLDKNQIERLASNRDVYSRGHKIFTENRIKSLNFTEENGRTNVAALVEGDSDEYTVDVIFDQNGILQKYCCNCDAFGIWRGGCKHVVAVFLQLFENSRQTALVSKSRRASRNLLTLFEKQAYADIDKSLPLISATAAVTLAPTICVTNGEARLNFEIGVKRMYILRNIQAFVTALRNEATVAYGKGLEFKHAMHAFEPKSRQLVEFMLSERDFMERSGRIISNSFSFYFSALNDRYFPLTPGALDKFFELYTGETIKADMQSTGAATAVLSVEKPDISFALSLSQEGPSLEFCGETSPVMIKGERYGYILNDGSLRRVEYAYYDVIAPILSAMKTINAKILFFGKSDSQKFNAFLLPALRSHGLISPESVSKPLVTGGVSLSNKAYLDAEDGNIVCRPVFCYGEREIPFKDDSVCPGRRDAVGEYRFMRTFVTMGFSERGDEMVLSDDDAIFDFLYSEHGLNRLYEISEVYVTDAFSRIQTRPKSSPSFGLRISGNLLEVDIGTGDFTIAELLGALESYKLRKRYHKLTDGRFVDMSQLGDSAEETLTAIDAVVSGLGLSEKDLEAGTVKVPRYRALYAGEVLGGRGNVSCDEGVRKLLEDFKSFRELTFSVPESLEHVLRPYQREGYKWLKTLARYGFGGILADDMGLGKTLQMITVLLSEKEGGETNKPSMVVAPTSLIYNWEKEISRFAPELSVMLLSGTAAKRRDDFAKTGAAEMQADVYITTYDMLKRDIENYTDTDFRFVIADEAQNIKNPGTQNAKAVKMLKADVCFALTGTPMENALSELWSIFDFIMPGYLFNASRYQKHYEGPIVKNDDKSRALELKRQISPFILRRLKADVLTELPEKVETTLFADMPEEQRRIYTAYLLKAKGELDETVKQGRYNESQIEILAMLTRLRQICCHPATFTEDYKGDSGKLTLTMETVMTSLEQGHRLLIFSQFTRMLCILKEHLDKAGVEYFYLHGSTPSKERLDMAERFNGGECGVFLISLKAGGTGLNLTGADVVIHYDPWWNPAVMNQAADRAHRFGQSKTVQVINIVAKDTVEEKIIALQNKKKDLIGSVIEEGANFINKLTQDELMHLFKL